MPIVLRLHGKHETDGGLDTFNHVSRDNTDYPFHFTNTGTTVHEDGSAHIAQMHNYEVAHVAFVVVEKGEGATVLNYVGTVDGEEVVRIEHAPPQNDPLL